MAGLAGNQIIDEKYPKYLYCMNSGDEAEVEELSVLASNLGHASFGVIFIFR